MKKVALFSDDYIVKNVIAVDEGKSVEYVLSELGLKSPYMDVTNQDISIGQQFSVKHERFIPKNFMPSFVWDEDLWKWVNPIAPPSDATWVPELHEKPEGHDDLPIKRVYFWIEKYTTWGLAPCDCNPKPSEEHYWNPIDQEWQLPDSVKPEGSYDWDTIEKIWIEI